MTLGAAVGIITVICMSTSSNANASVRGTVSVGVNTGVR